MSGSDRQRNLSGAANHAEAIADFVVRRPANTAELGASSRERILDSAAKLFASRGYDGVSTRALAKTAQVNLSAIAYHFGGKDKLYREVLHRLIADSEPLIRPVISRLNSAPTLANDRFALAELSAWFVRHLLGTILSDGRAGQQMALLMREFHQPSPAFSIVLEGRVNPLHDAVAGLVGAATGRDAMDSQTLLLTHAVIGQCMSFGAVRTVVWARLEWDGYTPARVDTVIQTVTAAVLAMLGLPSEFPSADR